MSTFDLTFEVSFDSDGAQRLSITLNSHKGRANREPANHTQAVVNALVDYLTDNARELGLYEFAQNCVAPGNDAPNQQGNPDQGEEEVEDEAAFAKLRAAAIVTREYLSDLASSL